MAKEYATLCRAAWAIGFVVVTGCSAVDEDHGQSRTSWSEGSVQSAISHGANWYLVDELCPEVGMIYVSVDQRLADTSAIQAAGARAINKCREDFQDAVSQRVLTKQSEKGFVSFEPTVIMIFLRDDEKLVAVLLPVESAFASESAQKVIESAFIHTMRETDRNFGRMGVEVLAEYNRGSSKENGKRTDAIQLDVE